jgi:predicted DNA-binding antitoxin AbrB/MazE fold protein
MAKVIEAVYENGVFRPLGKVELKEGEKVKIVIKKSVFGILKGWKVDAQKVKDELREIHG